MTCYLDIETIPAYKTMADAPERLQKLWAAKNRASEKTPEELWPEATFHAEFNLIAVVSLGKIINPTPLVSDPVESEGIRIKSLVNRSGDLLGERQLLVELAAILKGFTALAAHFGKGFDFPVLARKYLIHGLTVPALLNTTGLKPWEINLIDTQDIWKFGSYKGTISLDLLAYSYGLPSPKDEMDGSRVAEEFYAGNMDKIVAYCESDVLTLINVHRRMTGLGAIKRVDNVIGSESKLTKL